MKGRPRLSDADRIRLFWQRADTSGGDDACWSYRGAALPNGYCPVTWRVGNKDYAHRIAYRLTYGDIPEGGLVRQTCKNHRCVNPRHLILATWDDVAATNAPPVLHGDAHPSTKLSDAAIADIRRRYAAGGVMQKDLANEYGVHYSLISLIVNGKRRQVA